ncbi:MAG: tetratricopeptide repeat protein [Paracoccaceae bacterium]|nr:tetratricopeptide repeat protein [Paracoccaceae bacterium]
MLSFNLGSQKFPVSTNSSDAQRYFDQGLNWCFAFNQEEGLACFRKGLELDPVCAMFHWGIAYAAGPFYNMPWVDFSEAETIECTAFCRTHINKALTLSKESEPLEFALVQALTQRVQKPKIVSKEEFDRWDDDYADAMRLINQDFPDNLEVMALFIEALMMRTPWRMWDVVTNLPPKNADTYEAIEVCERGIALADAREQKQHPAILHLYIHLLEMSDHPEKALHSANLLGELCPDAGHIHHMPGHIYELVGDYESARKASETAIIADRKYLAYAGSHNYYTTARCHDLHLMMHACMMLGQFKPAMAAAEEICDNLHPDILNRKGKPFISGTLESYYSTKMHVLVRFGRWKDIIKAAIPDCPDLYIVSIPMHHYAKAIAYATLGQFTAANQERSLFYKTTSRVPPDRKYFNNSATQVLGVAEQMMEGEVEYHKGKYSLAFNHLRESVRRCDDLHYSEPWPWMHPPRHALGALLLEQGHYEEAEALYRADLGLNKTVYRCAQNRNNIWSLHGLVECLIHRQEKIELTVMKRNLTNAMERAGIAITSSCCCRKSIVKLHLGPYLSKGNI